MGRNRILEGAVDILDQGVYGDLTVDALARALRMSKSTLYKYFTSKDDVVVALIDGICGQTEAALVAVQSGTLPPLEAVSKIFAVLSSHADRLPRAIVLQVARLPPACQDRLSLTRSAVLQSLERVIERGRTDGAVTYSESMLAAQAMLAAVDAAMRASARGEVALDRGQAVESLLGLFLPGLSR
jgi:AcrR family transcriptional regulator